MHLLSFRVKMVLVILASVLTAVFLVFAFGNYYINRLQKRNVEAAVNLAQEQARELSRDVLKLLADQHTSDVSDPQLRESLKPMTEVVFRLNKSVVWAGVFDAQGNRVIERVEAGDQVFRSEDGGSEPHVSEIPVHGSGTFEVSVKTTGRNLRTVSHPIQREGKKVGEIRLEVTQTPTFERIENTSRTITDALVAECLLLLLVLLVVFAILWWLFSKQVKLINKNAALDRMAYVGTLASGLAHEIRNPLSAMNINLEVMGEEISDPRAGSSERALGLAKRVQSEVQQLNSTLTSFLEFALPSKESISSFPLRALLEELIESHSAQMQKAGINCELVSAPAKETLIEADRRLIHQALRNIMVNAIQALEGSVKKQLRIRIEPRADRRTRVTICDSGPGIAPENLGRIFEVFFSTRKGGSGFGLAITQKIIEEHKGRVWAENNEGSLGASFCVELPRESQVVS